MRGLHKFHFCQEESLGAAPAAFTVFGIPDTEAKTNHYEIKIPWMLGLIATRSVNTQLPGIEDQARSFAHQLAQD